MLFFVIIFNSAALRGFIINSELLSGLVKTVTVLFKIALFLSGFSAVKHKIGDFIDIVFLLITPITV